MIIFRADPLSALRRVIYIETTILWLHLLGKITKMRLTINHCKLTSYFKINIKRHIVRRKNYDGLTCGSRTLPSARGRLAEDTCQRSTRKYSDTAKTRNPLPTWCSRQSKPEPCDDHNRSDLMKYVKTKRERQINVQHYKIIIFKNNCSLEAIVYCCTGWCLYSSIARRSSFH